MANVADCAFAVAKDDLQKLSGAITRSDTEEGDEQEFVFDIISVDDRHSVRHYRKHIFRGETVDYYEVDGKKYSAEKYREKFSLDKWLCDFQTHKCLKDCVYSNGWRVDWRALHSFSYDSVAYVAEYDDHITVYFGGRWDFPQDLIDLLNEKEVRWQGAVAESGCDVLDDELGNEDFGLVASITKDDDGFDNYYVEDRSE